MTVNVTRDAINVREKLAELDKPTGIAGEAMLRAETPQEQQALIGVGRRNVLINGSFNIYQRGGSGTVTAGLNYISDRWQHRGGNNVGGTTTYAHDVVDGTSRLKVTYSGATGNAYIQQPIEAQNLYGMWDNYVTVSFYTTDENPIITAFGYNSGGTESTMLASTRPTSLGNNRWSHTFFLASPSGGPREGNAYGIGLVFIPNDQNAPEDGTIEWWGMQFEKGSCATPFEHRSYGEELALCQRYYHVEGFRQYQRYGAGFAYSTTGAAIVVHLPTAMRSTPAISTSYLGLNYGADTINALSSIAINTGGSSEKTVGLSPSVASGLTVGQAVLLINNNNTNGYIAFDAEL